MNVPFMDLKTQHQRLRPDLLRSWEEILDEASFIGGSPVERFENIFAEFCETRHAIGVGNGTDALVLALTALGIGAGDSVILPANSFIATAEAVVHAGATPVFVDANPRTYNIDVDQIERHITPEVKAIIAVHLYGQPADMDPILEIAGRYGLRVIEDSAQAHGARYRGRRAGSIGDVACFSFYPAKNLGACGDGGAVVTNDADIAQTVRKLRDHGGLKRYQHDIVGFNSRLDSLQAAALCLKLPQLDKWNAFRRRNAILYNDLLSGADGIVTPFEPEYVEGVYHLYVIRVENGQRDRLKSYLADNGVQTGIHYPAVIPGTPAFAHFRTTDCSVAANYAHQILSLPMYPELSRHQLQYVASLVDGYRSISTPEPNSPFVSTVSIQGE